MTANLEGAGLSADDPVALMCWMWRQVKTMDYDCIVFDTAPTGHTLRLLQFPATLEKGLSKLMQLRGTFGGAISQIGAMLGANVDEMQNQLLGRLEELKVRTLHPSVSDMPVLSRDAGHGPQHSVLA